MIDFNIALELVGEIAQTLDPITIPVINSVGYILDEDIYSPLDMPPFVKSAMDGYAYKNELKDYTKAKIKNIITPFSITYTNFNTINNFGIIFRSILKSILILSRLR